MQPILTSPRKGNARCTACHSRGGGNSYLEELSPGSTTRTTRSRSRRNFERVLRLVVPGRAAQEPAADQPAGGRSRRQPLARRRQALAVAERSRMADARRLGRTTSAAPRRAGRRGTAAAPRPVPHRRRHCRAGDDAEPRSVQDARAADPHEPAQGQRALHRLPFARRRQQLSRSAVAGRARPTTRSRRAAISSASSGWSFPGEPLKSLLLVNPLAEEAGGSHWHGGGKHWQLAERSRVADPRGLGARFVIRADAFLGHGPDARARRLLSRRACWPRRSAPLRYRPLARPVLVPLERVWRRRGARARSSPRR